MNLFDKLKSKVKKYCDKDSCGKIKPYVHKMETADELYKLIAKACKYRADGGCCSIRYHWDYVYSDNKEEWEKQKVIREEVVERLRKEGLTVESSPEEFPERQWLEFYQEWEQETAHHYIDVYWK
jgi:hypothetical protein